MTKLRIPSPIRKWTALKLEYLDHYLQAYVIATKRAGEIYYVDPFCGCGECIMPESGLRVDGSPWRALNTIPPFTRYYFVEKEPTLASHLREAIWRKGLTNAKVYCGDCNQVIPEEVLPNIPRDVPSFAFLDPFGLQLDWDTVQMLASHRVGRKMELLVLYHHMVIARLLRLAMVEGSYAARLTRFYGDESWREHFSQSMKAGEIAEQRRQRFLVLYTSKLRSLGYKYVEPYGPLGSGRKPLYHVVFASDHAVGARIMHDVWSKTRFVPGELGYKPVKRPRAKGLD